MKFITGKDRNQTEFFCLEQAIAQDNEVRLIDLFVASINLADFGFDMQFIDNGRPSYHPSELLRLFIYGKATIAGKLTLMWNGQIVFEVKYASFGETM